MTTQPDETPRSARLEAALEDRLQGNQPPDLSAAILAAAGAAPSTPSRNRWLVAALVLLGLSIVPAIHWLNQRGHAERPIAPGDSAPQDPAPQDPAPSVEDPNEILRPESLAELLPLLDDVRGLSARTAMIYGLPLQVAGEADVPFVPLYGEGARRDLGWCTTLAENDGPALTQLVASMSNLGPVFESHHELRRIEVRFALSDGRTAEITVILPGGTALGGHTFPGDGAAAIGRTYPSTTVWVHLGSTYLSTRSSRELRDAWGLVDALATTTLRHDRGVYWGAELERESANAKRARSLRLHEATPEQLATLGGSEACVAMDLRSSSRLASAAGIRELRLFPKLRSLLVGPGAVGDAFGDGPLPSVEELIMLGEHDNPRAAAPREPVAAKLSANGAGPLFRAFPNLRVLVAPGVRATTRDLEALPDSLEVLNVRFRREDGGRAWGDDGLSSLSQRRNLRMLDLGYARNGLNAKGTDPGLATVVALNGAPQLEMLNLDGWFDRAAAGGVPDPLTRRTDALAKLSTLPGLESLSLRDNGDLTNADAVALSTAPNLRFLDLRGSWQIQRSALAFLERALPRCKVLPSSAQHTVTLRVLASDDYDVAGVTFDLDRERARLQEWLQARAMARYARPGGSALDAQATLPELLAAYHALPTAEGGPLAGANLRWVVHRITRDPRDSGRWGLALSREYPQVLPLGGDPTVAPGRNAPRELTELVPVNMHEASFATGDFSHAAAATEPGSTQPVLNYALRPERVEAYGDLTERHVGNSMVILLGDEVISAPKLVSPIRGGSGRIGGMDATLAQRLAHLLSDRW